MSLKGRGPSREFAGEKSEIYAKQMGNGAAPVSHLLWPISVYVCVSE